jgi:2-dehydropantoate 2-reductase
MGTMRFVIYGAGAIGGTIGARLFQHGYPVLLIARGAHLEAIRRRGLVFKSPAETVTLPMECVGHPSEARLEAGDLVLMAMKAQHTEDALRALRDAAGQGVPVVCAQNGVANEAMALRLFRRVYGMCVYIPATHLEPGVVQTEARTTTGILDVGLYPSGSDETAGRLADALSRAGFSCRAVADVMRWKYEKLLGNLRNALGVLCGEADKAQAVAAMATREALDCYAAAGIEWASKEEVTERHARLLELGTVDGRPRPGSSSWQSIARGTGSIETDYLNGEIVLIGRQHGVPTPANEVLQTLAARIAREGARPGRYSARDLEAAIREAGGRL